MSRQRRNVALLGRQKIHSFDTPFSITNLQEFSYPCYPQRPQPFRCFAPCSARFQSRGLRRRLDVEGTRAQTRFSRNMNTSIQNRPLVAGQPNIAFSSLPLRKKRLLFASPARFRAEPKINRQKSSGARRKTPNISRPSPRYIYRRENIRHFPRFGRPAKRPLQYPRTAQRHASSQNRRSKGESTAYKKILSKFLLQFHTPTCDDQFVV